MRMQTKKLIWNLDEISPLHKFDDLLKETEKEMEKVDGWWKKLNPKMTTAEFGKYIEYDQNLDEKISRLVYLPELMEATNQKDSQARLMKARVNDLILKYNQKARKIGHWLKGLTIEGKENLDDKNAKRLFDSVADLEYVLTYSRTAAKHTLSQKEEEIIDNKDVVGQQVISDLRALIEADFVYDLNGRKIKTQGELLKYVHSKSPKMREGAYRALFEKHKENIDKLFVIYQSVVKNWAYEARIRGYESPLAMRNFGNHVTDKSVEVLLKVCREERKIFWRYFEYKAKSLKKKRLNRFDLYAPKKTTKNEQYDFEQSKKLVLDSLGQFCKKFAEYGEKIITDQHVDSHPKVNKRSGAFCATVGPKIAPYVLLNHTNTLRDVSTLAHELGHAIHSLYANHHYPASQHANLPLSETASTLAEMILFEKMIATEKDSEIKKQMLWEKIADSYATILRQNYFVMFEIEAHKMVARGTTAKELCDLYLKNLREQFGKSVMVEPIFKYEWLYISHIFESPFYCYAYNFGELLSLSLYARYKKEGKSFVAKIEKILAAGGSRDPKEVLEDVGIDMESEEFWRGGFRVVADLQIELERV
jgi:oligoendopeptidase F